MIEKQYKPIPSAYVYYSPSEAREETKLYFEKIAGIYENLRKKGAYYRNKINCLLAGKTDAKQLSELMLIDEYRELCYYDGELNTMVVIGQIALKEESVGLPTIIRNVSSMEEAIYLFQKVTFGIRRVAFGWEKEELSDFIQFLKNDKISYICLAECLRQGTIVNQVATASRLAILMTEQNLTMEALKMLILLDTMFQYSEEKILIFTNTFLEVGAKRLAYEELIKHQNPNDKITDLIQQLAE